jgi:hypothetical protein
MKVALENADFGASYRDLTVIGSLCVNFVALVLVLCFGE